MIVFLCGKGEAALRICRWLVARKWRVFVFTHADADLYPYAQQAGLWCTLRSVNEVEAWPVRPALIVSAGYLHILTGEAIDAAQGAVINCHYALLPNHRGRSAVPWTILDGDSVAGVTYHWIDCGVDSGRILLQATCAVADDETQASLFAKLHELAIGYFPAALKLALARWGGVEQRGPAQVHKAGPPHGGVVNPAWPDEYVERFIRAMTLPPLPYAKLNGVEVRTMDEYRRLASKAQVYG